MSLAIRWKAKPAREASLRKKGTRPYQAYRIGLILMFQVGVLFVDQSQYLIAPGQVQAFTSCLHLKLI